MLNAQACLFWKITDQYYTLPHWAVIMLFNKECWVDWKVDSDGCIAVLHSVLNGSRVWLWFTVILLLSDQIRVNTEFIIDSMSLAGQETENTAKGRLLQMFLQAFQTGPALEGDQVYYNLLNF